MIVIDCPCGVESPLVETGSVLESLTQTPCKRSRMHGFDEFTIRCTVCGAVEKSGPLHKPNPATAVRDDMRFIEKHQRCELGATA